MVVWKKSLILGLTLLAFCVLVDTMGFCKFAKMFPPEEEKHLIKDETFQEKKDENEANNRTTATTAGNIFTELVTITNEEIFPNTFKPSSQAFSEYFLDDITALSAGVHSVTSLTTVERATFSGVDCPFGYNKKLNNSCYKFAASGSGATRSEARSACKGDSSHLAFIETKEEKDFLIREAENNTEYWIGIHERPNLFWDSGNQVTFANIHPDNDATFDEDTGCYVMSDNDERYWTDHQCSAQYGFICEFEGTDCPSDYNKKLNNSCYKFAASGSGATRSEARSTCKGDSSHLVFIETKEENDFLVGEAANGTAYWIGIHHRPHLFWDNGNQVTFTNFNPDHEWTFNDGKGCYRISGKAGLWYDNPSFREIGYICECKGAGCPSEYNKELYNSYYKFVDARLPRFNAQLACKGDSSHLVFIETKEENDFLVKDGSHTEYWIGIHGRPNLFWDNGNRVTFANIDPDNWCTFLDNNGCYRMAGDNERRWLNSSCKEEYGFICEYEGVDCPSGYNKKLNDSCYKFAASGSGATRSEARSACKGDSSHLVFIETKEEKDFLIREAENNTEYWIGIHERPNLFWNNGNQVTFANINPDEGATFNDSTGCYNMSNSVGKYWFDDDCKRNNGFICEYEG